MPGQDQPEPTLGGRIRWRRKALGLTQKQVAAAMGVKSDNSVRLWEQDEQAPDVERLGRALGVRPAWLAAGEEPMLPPTIVDREQLDRIEALLVEIRDGLSAPGQQGQETEAARRARLQREDRGVEDDLGGEAQHGQE